MCGVAIYGAGSCGVSLSTARFGSAKRRARLRHFGHARNENTWREQQINLLHEAHYFFFLLSAQSPRMTLLLWAEEEAAMKTPPPPSSSGERHTNAHVVSVLRPSLTFNGLQIMTVEFGCFHWLMQFQQIVLNRLIYMHPLFPYPCIFFLLRIEIIKTGMK